MTTALEKMREFIQSYPGADILDALNVDYTDHVPNMGGLFPSGLVENARRRFILGDVEVDQQYNFALYTVLEKAPGEDDGATVNAEWLMDFQEWVQEQSALGMAPTFGDDPRRESMVAGNGSVYSADEEGWAVYAIQISVSFTKHYERS